MAVLPETRQRLAQQGLVRPRRGRIVAGVCAGIARRFGVSATLVRVLFALSIVLPGPQIVVYLLLWILMPKEPRSR
jgi:phage shock protein PspC (stress-responsive transcriptional regulator)